MPEPILDFHTHAQNVFGMCCVSPSWRWLARNGLARLYEKTGFHPGLKRLESPLSTRMIVREMQSRFASFTFDDYLAAMRQSGVTHACALPVEPFAETADLLRLIAGHPEVIPFASVRFDGGDPISRLHGHLAAGCRGVKIHPIMQNISPDDERVFAVFESLRGTELPVIFHTGRMEYFLGRHPEGPDLADPPRFLSLLRRFPAHPIVFGHMGLLHAQPAIDIAADHPNVYLELSFQPAAVVAEALRRVGSERVLLGSDWPASEAATEISVLRRAVGGDRGVLRRVLFENGATLLRRAGARL
jgi:predicted TIM-barrel fold metal-dependent hydrolase